MKQLTTQIICDLLAIGSNITDFTLEENKVSIKAVTGEENGDIDYFIKLLLRKQNNERYAALITLPNGEERFKNPIQEKPLRSLRIGLTESSILINAQSNLIL